MQKEFKSRGLSLGPGAVYLPGHLDVDTQRQLAKEIKEILEQAPLFVPRMPRTGQPFSVRMSNCGTLGWVSDAARGYRYQATHPDTDQPWPAMPGRLLDIWRQVAPAAREPEACLINLYAGGARMGSHRDADEQDFAAPVVSVSLGDTATFHVGGLARRDPKQRIRLGSGDVVVLGGKARLAYHGIDRIHAGTSRLLAEAGIADGGRINLTLRRVNP
ncbi:MAG: alpha-ketoglutarate-dependent dioxygenase AlkB [Hyphomicrobiaceae bacterium]|nr:alpha-ketoglutarate-dependent dioxygenase AlkB [Hyphomicrobiaceae bacterium]